MGLGGMKLDRPAGRGPAAGEARRDRMALKIDHVGEYGEHAIAKRAGLQKGDIIVAVDGNDRRMTESNFSNIPSARNAAGDTMAVTVVREGMRKTFSYVLP